MNVPMSAIEIAVLLSFIGYLSILSVSENNNGEDMILAF